VRQIAGETSVADGLGIRLHNSVSIVRERRCEAQTSGIADGAPDRTTPWVVL